MKSIYLIILSICLNACFSHSFTFAQSKEMTLKTDHIFQIMPSGDNHFLVVYGKLATYARRPKAKKYIMKYKQDLEPVWKEPVVFSEDLLDLSYNPSYPQTGVSNPLAAATSNLVYSHFCYTDTMAKTTFDYLFGVKNFLQIRSDGSIKEQKTDIPAKEARDTAAAFVNNKGFNILTMTGDERFPTGSFNWYTYSHDNLTMTKQKITLPLPSGIDRDNNSGWRLNEVTDSGLYFYYSSFKDDYKDKSRPNLAMHIVRVDPTGKVGTMVNLILNQKDFTLLPVEFQQDRYPQLSVMQPSLYKRSISTVNTPNMQSTGLNNQYSTSTTNHNVPNDNSYLGIKIDEKANRIYTVTAVKVDSGEGKGMRFVARPNDKISYLDFNVFDLEGKRIAESHIKFKLPELNARDNYDKHAHHISLQSLPNTEGVLCKLMSNYNGFVWGFNIQGEKILEEKISSFDSKRRLDYHVYPDVFSAAYFSFKDFNNSPYMLKSQSPTYKLYHALADKAKLSSLYLSLKDYEVFIVNNPFKQTNTYYSFTKK